MLPSQESLKAWILSALMVHGAVAGNPDAKRLYDDLLSNYNKLVRPVVNTTDVLKVCIKLKLSQLIDVVSIKSRYDIFNLLIYLKQVNTNRNCNVLICIYYEFLLQNILNKSARSVDSVKC